MATSSPFDFGNISGVASAAHRRAKYTAKAWGFKSFRDRREKEYQEQVRKTRQQDFYDRREFSAKVDVEKEQRIQNIRFQARRADEAARLRYKSADRWNAFSDQQQQADIKTVRDAYRSDFKHRQRMQQQADRAAQAHQARVAGYSAAQAHAQAMGDIRADALRKAAAARAQGVADVGRSRADAVRAQAAAHADALRTKATAAAQAAQIRAQGTADAARRVAQGRAEAMRDVANARVHGAYAANQVANLRANAARVRARGQADAIRTVSGARLAASENQPKIAENEATAMRIRAAAQAEAIGTIGSARSRSRSRSQAAPQQTVTPPPEVVGSKQRKAASKPKAEPRSVSSGFRPEHEGNVKPIAEAVSSPEGVVNLRQVAPTPKTSDKAKPVEQAKPSRIETPIPSSPRAARTPRPTGGVPVHVLHQTFRDTRGLRDARQFSGVRITPHESHAFNLSRPAWETRRLGDQVRDAMRHPGFRQISDEDLPAYRKARGID